MSADAIDLTAVQFLCLLGGVPEDACWVASWLDESLARRLVCIDDDSSLLDEMREAFFSNPQVKFIAIDSPLQIEPLAKQIAWQGVLLKAAIAGKKRQALAPFSEIFERTHLAANLILSDAADCGKSAALHSQFHLKRLTRNGLKLSGAFEGVPALIVGAGPSLEKNSHWLRSLQERALIFAAGSALNALAIQPHFGASIDSKVPYQQFKQQLFWEVPFFFQSRMNTENFSLLHSEAIWFPDSHHSFLNWIEGEEKNFDGGWTVGNFLTRVALFLGCNPIVFVGMDLCYEGTRKYAYIKEEAGQEGLVEVISNNGSKVWTQTDWLMARDWTEALIRQNPQRQWIDARGGGLEFRANIQKMSLADIDLPWKGDLRKMAHLAIQNLPFKSKELNRRDAWRCSLRKCLEIIELPISSQAPLLAEEIVYEKLLLPLWQVWRPIFSRSLDLDPYPIRAEEKLQLHQMLFFQRVIEEHLHVI